MADDKWNDDISASYTDVGTHSFAFMATAANHENTYGLFTVKVAPAPLSATIGDVLLSYIGEAQTPEVVTNVTGLVHGEINPLTCVFRDEAGEWQADVPPFTNPGEYTLYFKVSAPNHADFVTNCTVTIKGWDYKVNMDGKSGFGTEIHVSDPGWLLKASGRKGSEFAVDLERYGHLDEVCPNGLKLWQNYVINRTNLTKRLVATIMQRGSRVGQNAFAVHFPGVEVLQNTGLATRYRLDKRLKGESEFTTGELTDKYETSVPLGPADPTGLYVFNIVLTPTNNVETGEAMYGGGESVLASCTTVGVIRVASVLTNTVVAVPWRSMALDTTNMIDIAVSDMVNPNGVTGGDMILHYHAKERVFSGWTRSETTAAGWDARATVTKKGVRLKEAESEEISPGNAFWLVRHAPGAVGATNYIYLVGRYTGESYAMPVEGGTKAAPGNTLLANPTMFDIDLNSLVFVDGDGNAAEPAQDDRIVTQNISGTQTIHYRSKKTPSKWLHNETKKVGGRIKNVPVEGGAIPAGTGFWYVRTAEAALNIKFPAADKEM